MKKLNILLLLILSAFVCLTLCACGGTEDDFDDNDGIEVCPDGRHEFSVWEVEKVATCTENGWQIRTCVICKQYKERQEVKDSTNHNFDGYICTRCGFSNAPTGINYTLSNNGEYYILSSVDVMDVTEYTVETEYDGLPVKEIAAGAFKNCTKLEVVTIPDTIERIGEGAFSGCHNIKKMTIPFVGRDKRGTVPYFGHIFGTPDATIGLYPVDQGTGENFKRYWISPEIIQVNVTGGELHEGCFQNCGLIKRVEYTGAGTMIHANAFNNCRGLDAVIFPLTVTEFGDYCFYKCEELDTFPISEGIEKIGAYCFAGCKTEYLGIPSTLTDVGEAAFIDCNNIKNIFIPATLTRLSNSMFEGCSALEKVELASPDGSYKIKSIGRQCFLGCELLKEVIISSSVEEIREGAFYKCVSLETVNFPSSLTLLDKSAFALCSSLKEIRISNGLKRIETFAFDRCTSLETVNLPSSLSEIGENAFYGCSSLVNFNINAANSNFSSENGHIFSTGKTNLILVAPGYKEDTLIIPEGVTGILGGAFANATSIKNVVLPKSLKKIADDAFYQHPSLTSITIDASMEYIGVSAFALCPKLEEVKIKGVTLICDSAFAECKALKSVTLENVETVSMNAFHLCPSLETVSLAEIKTLGENSFAECKKLKTLTIGNNVQEIGLEAFAYCDSIEELVIGEGNISIADFAFSYCRGLKSVEILNGCVSIGEATFEGCAKLEEVTFPKSLNSINAYAFKNCLALTTFKIDPMNAKYGITRSIFMVENNSKTGERTLVIVAPGAITEELTIPNNIHSIGPYVFRHAIQLKKVILPDTLTTIGEEAFFDSGLTELDLNKVVTIKDYAFGQTRITSVVIPESVTTIDRYAFQYCNDLKEIYIRSTVEKVGFAAFHNVGTAEAPLKVYLEFADEESIPSKWNKSWSQSAVTEIIYGYKFE